MSEQVIHIRDVSLKKGTVVADRYEVTQHLGTGGFAQVFEAFDTNIERPVAIKFLNLHTTQTDPASADKILARFKREAKLAAKIQHPNVVNIFDFGLVGRNSNVPYIVMELLSGHDLEEQLYGTGPLSPERGIPLFVSCLEALGEAHKLGIVHKDLKPSNLFLANPGQRTESLRIVDFGIAHIRDTSEGRLTATGEILGTPQYLSPEYIEAQVVTPAFDVYQMGLILVEALTGTPVVDESHPLRCVKVHSMGELDLPEALLQSPLGPVVARALHYDHTQRFTNAEEFADALAEIDLADVPKLGPDMPMARLAAAGTLDSGSRMIKQGTGQMPQPTTGQLSAQDAGGSNTQLAYGQRVDQSGNISERPTAQNARANNQTTAQVHNSTQAVIDEAGLNKKSIKALAVLGVAVLLLGGVAAWLLLSKVGDSNAAADSQAVAAAESDSAPSPAAAAASPGEQPEADQAVQEAEAAAAANAEAGPGDDQAEAEADTEATAKAAAAAPAEPEPVEVTVDSSPGGAVVYRGDEKLGETPVAIEFDNPEADPADLKLVRSGYHSERITVSPDGDATVDVDLRRRRPEPKPEPRVRKPEPKPQPKPQPKPEPKPEPADKPEKKPTRMLVAP